MQTPWGPSQHAERRAEGIVFHSTASHGGYLLDATRMVRFREIFPDFETFAGGPWFEEDQDAAVIALRWPGLFTDAEVRSAVRIARLSAKPFNGKRYPGWEAVVRWLDESPAGKAITERVRRFEVRNADHWETGSCGTVGVDNKGWWVSLRRIGDGARQDRVFAEYPTQPLYTDAELAEVSSEARDRVTV